MMTSHVPILYLAGLTIILLALATHKTQAAVSSRLKRGCGDEHWCKTMRKRNGAALGDDVKPTGRLSDILFKSYLKRTLQNEAKEMKPQEKSPFDLPYDLSQEMPGVGQKNTPSLHQLADFLNNLESFEQSRVANERQGEKEEDPGQLLLDYLAIIRRLKDRRVGSDY